MYFSASVLIIISCFMKHYISAQDSILQNHIPSQISSASNVLRSENTNNHISNHLDVSNSHESMSTLSTNSRRLDMIDELVDNMKKNMKKNTKLSLLASTPTASPVEEPSPTAAPTEETTAPVTSEPTKNPTSAPSPAPSAWPTVAPTTAFPTAEPTRHPTSAPSYTPSARPTNALNTAFPTRAPTEEAPSQFPTREPSEEQPTLSPTEESPTLAPTSEPSEEHPTLSPTEESPTLAPTLAPNEEEPTMDISIAPTDAPVAAPTAPPLAPTEPTAFPSAEATIAPTIAPSSRPSVSLTPTTRPTVQPTASPSLGPGETYPPTRSFRPTAAPTLVPAQVELQSVQGMDGVTSSEFLADSSTSDAFCGAAITSAAIDYPTTCGIQGVLDSRRRLSDDQHHRILQTPSIEISYTLVFVVPNGGSDTTDLANSLAAAAKANLVNAVMGGAFTASFMSQLTALGVTDPALLAASSNSISVIVIVTVATSAPSAEPTRSPVSPSSNGDEKYRTGGYLALWIIIGLLVGGGVSGAFYFLYLRDKLSVQHYGVKEPESSDPIELVVHKTRRASHQEHTRRHSSTVDPNATDSLTQAAAAASRSTSSASRFSFGVMPRFSSFWEDNPSNKGRPSQDKGAAYIVPSPASEETAAGQRASHDNHHSPKRATTVNKTGTKPPVDARTSFALYDSYDPPRA